MPPMQSKYYPSKSTVRAPGHQSNGSGIDDNGWVIPLEPEETVFIEWRISHYRAMLKLRLTAEDRVNLIRMLADAEWKLAMRKLYLAKTAALVEEPGTPARPS